MYIYYKKTLLLFVAFVSIQTASAQEEETKVIKKAYALTGAGELYIESKYGNIIINGWDKDSIAIKANIKAMHKKRENAKDLLDRINPQIKVAGDFINITSEISDKNTGFISRYFNKINPFEPDKSNIQIDYTIFLPVKAEIEIINNFGDVIIADWQGELKVNLHHGDLWINDPITKADIEMKFGKLRAQSIDYANLNIKNGEVDLDEAKSLRMKSSGGTLQIEKVNELDIYSSKDKITIEEVTDISGDLSFSNVRLHNVINKINLSMHITDFVVSKIQNKSPAINIKQESSDININITDVSFNFNVTMEQGLIRIPKSFSNIETNVIDENKKIRVINAIYGTAPFGKLLMTGEKGIIILKEE